MTEYKNAKGEIFKYERSYYLERNGKMRPFIVIANDLSVQIVTPTGLAKNYTLVQK